MADVFSQNVSNVQSFKLGKTLIEIPGGSNLVCAGASFTYTQPVSPVIPLNASTKYMIVGEASGSGNLSMILGPSKDVQKFLKAYGNACNSNHNNCITLHAKGGCEGNQGNSFMLRGVVLNSINSTISRGGQGDLITATVQFVFTSLEIK